MQLPTDYPERVYAGVLGKIIGVYLGRPFEGAEYDRIERELGEITGYVHERFNVPLVVTDDDISGTFTFIRALEDFAASAAISAADIGRTWLNYLIEERTVLWWGGLGNSTEHTAYLRLKHGIEAPRSGSIALNSKVVAEQIGAQIFIDGWAMVAPGDPELAAALAAKAGSVSHDGEAVYGAQVLAAMEAAAFEESDIGTLLDTGLRFIPPDSVIARLIADLREWHPADGDWRRTFKRVQDRYGYDRYGGNCHMVPNHAIIILALLYGDGDFAHSLMIANTCGWDTDCNSGNVGCLLGIRNGLGGIDAPDAANGAGGAGKWRGPVADRLYLPTADGGRCITDAVQQSYRLINLGRALQGLDPVRPKGGARFHFSLPGSVQGFEAQGAATSAGNADGRLALRFGALSGTASAGATTATFMPQDADKVGGYQLLASPTLHSGQRVRARVDLDAAAGGAVACRLCATVFETEENVKELSSDPVAVAPGAGAELAWQMPDTDGHPIARIGVEVSAVAGEVAGTLYLDWLTWGGTPRANLSRPHGAAGERPKSRFFRPWWARAWVSGCSSLMAKNWAEPIRLIQNEGVGLAFQGGETWTDYRVTATVRLHMGNAGGIAARAGGMQRYYALLIGGDGVVRLVRHVNERTVLAEAPLVGEPTERHRLTLAVDGVIIRATVDDGPAMVATDDALRGGAVALIGEEGRVEYWDVDIAPV